MIKLFSLILLWCWIRPASNLGSTTLKVITLKDLLIDVLQIRFLRSSSLCFTWISCRIIFYYSLKYRAQVPTQIISISLLKSAETGASVLQEATVSLPCWVRLLYRARTRCQHPFQPARQKPNCLPSRKTSRSKMTKPRRADHYTLPAPSVNTVFFKAASEKTPEPAPAKIESIRFLRPSEPAAGSERMA